MTLQLRLPQWALRILARLRPRLMRDLERRSAMTGKASVGRSGTYASVEMQLTRPTEDE